MISQNDSPTIKDLREFGLLFGGFVIMFFGVLIPWVWGGVGHLPKWPFVFGAVIIMWGLLLPATLEPVYSVWMKLSNVMGWINTRIILALLYFGLFSPMAIVMKLFGKDPMARHFEKNRKSYRVPSRKPAADHMEKPY
jgi:hypothetical protein